MKLYFFMYFSWFFLGICSCISCNNLVFTIGLYDNYIYVLFFQIPTFLKFLICFGICSCISCNNLVFTICLYDNYIYVLFFQILTFLKFLICFGICSYISCNNLVFTICLYDNYIYVLFFQIPTFLKLCLIFCKTFKKVNDCRWDQLRINNVNLIWINLN